MVFVLFTFKEIFKDSSILQYKHDWVIQLEKWLPSNLKKKKTVRCYQATTNGWGASTFHSRCDSKGPTLVLIKSKSYVFGGFASKSWGGKLERIMLTLAVYLANKM